MTICSLFAGIGGFDLALTRLGHEIVYVNEWDKYAADTYEKNFKHRPDTRDITKVGATDIPEHDLLCGGFPCQSFSVAGKRGGFNDTRGTLFFEIARILKERQPRFCILENVKGLLSHDQGRTFSTIITTLDELGYDLQWQVLNSKNFGVPQNRERVFIIGNLRGEPRPKVFPIGENAPLPTKRQGKVSPTITQRYYKQGQSDPYIVVEKPDAGQSGLLEERNQPDSADSGRRKTHTSDIRRQPLKFLQRNQRNIEGDYAFTIDGANTGGVRVGMRIRKLTPLECERLQGFPDGWTAGVSDSQRYKQLGNAVTVNVVQAIVERLVS